MRRGFRFTAESLQRPSVCLRTYTETTIAIEAAHTNFWHKYIGSEGVIIGIDSFGASAPGEQLFERYGFTSANIEEVVEGII